MKIDEAITEVMRGTGAVGKDGYNQMQKFAYKSYDNVINSVSPQLRTVGVTVAPVDQDVTVEVFTSGKGTRTVDVWGTATFRWTGPEGDFKDVKVFATARDAADKSGAKFMTVANRINLLQTLSLPTDDPDPDSEYPEVHSAPQGAGQGAAKSDPDVLTVLRSAIQADAKAFNVPDEAMGDMVKRAGVKTRVSLCTDQVALQKLADLIRAEHG